MRLDSRFTEEEKRKLRAGAEQYLCEVSAILRKVPSDLLLLFKTKHVFCSLMRHCFVCVCVWCVCFFVLFCTNLDWLL
jgi:hypothetical protein